MTQKLIRIHSSDNVANVLDAIEAGCRVDGLGIELFAQQDIPKFHKIALVNIVAGTDVIRGGLPIGYATMNIRAGDHVHIQNLKSKRALGAKGDQA